MPRLMSLLCALVVALGAGCQPPKPETPAAAPSAPPPTAPPRAEADPRFEAYQEAMKGMSRELVPAIDALQRQIEAARKEAAQDPQKARAGLGNAYLAFSSAYDRVAKGLTDVDVPPGLERYHEVLLGGMRKLSSASNDTGRGILTQSEAMTRSGEEKMRNMQASFGKDLESALAGSGYAMDARGSLVKAR